MSPKEHATRVYEKFREPILMTYTYHHHIALIEAEITTAIDEALAGALQDVTDEEELDGPMPLHMREAFMSDPEKTLRAAVIATKKGIYERIDRRRNAIKERG